MSSKASLIRLRPLSYIHVQDTNTSITTLVVGPRTFTRAAHEQVVEGPSPMVAIPPRSYAVVQNPALRPDDDPRGAPLLDAAGQVRLRHGGEEVRLGKLDGAATGAAGAASAVQWVEPFPLYPGEKLAKSGITPLQVVNADCALLLRATADHVDAATGAGHAAGNEWLWYGPGTYIPSVNVTVVEVVKSIVVHENTALKLRARRGFTDRDGNVREAGAEWLYRTTGAFLPAVEEEVLGVVKATVLTDKRALHLRAAVSFTDVFGQARRAGDEWLVTVSDAPTHIPDVHEQVVADVAVTTLSSRQYAVVLNPVHADGSQRVGEKELRRGEASFFLKPGESLENGIQNVIVLGEDEALLLTASEDFVDDTGDVGEARVGKAAAAKAAAAATTTTTAGGGDKKKGGAATPAGKPVKRAAGTRWMTYGPREYTPPIQVQVLAKRRAIPLDQNEGVYVRNLKTGRVSAVIGSSYMLAPDEELWAKTLPPAVEALLAKQGRDKVGSTSAGAASSSAAATPKRDPTRVVTYRAPHNSAVQVYDYKKQRSRVVFGPELICLNPNEEFTVLSLSGGTPKKEGQIRSVALLLGPDFMSDVVLVETSDHARLSLKLSYNWHFEVDAKSRAGGDAGDDDAAAQQLFAVGDFVGDACKAVASMVRAAVAATSFDDFHKHSARVIRSAVFGLDERAKVRDRLVFVANRLVITNIDIQSVEPVDQRTRDALQKSVQLAIEITTKSQEATARHEAERLEQEAKGRLERQKITDAAEAEKARKQLVSLQAQSLAVEAEGEAKAAATAEADAALISGQASLKSAELRAKAIRIKGEVDVAQLKAKTEQELQHQKALDELEIARAQELAQIEIEKFKKTVSSIGADVLAEIAQSGPKAQAELLEGLGLSTVLMTDGSTPISLVDAAKGLVANP